MVKADDPWTPAQSVRQDSSMFDAAIVFHRDNPEVYKLFRRFALEAVASGRDYFGAKMIWERLRWYTMIETRGEPYKLNNNHHSVYARMFIAEYPQHARFFQLRSSAASGFSTNQDPFA